MAVSNLRSRAASTVPGLMRGDRHSRLGSLLQTGRTRFVVQPRFGHEGLQLRKQGIPFLVALCGDSPAKCRWIRANRWWGIAVFRLDLAAVADPAKPDEQVLMLTDY